MTLIPKVSLRPYEPERHLDLLQKWLARSHVSRWWGTSDKAMEELKRYPDAMRAMIVADDTVAGFLCWQELTNDERDAAGLSDLQKDLIDIDILIGERDFLGRGIGSRALGLLLDRLRKEGGASAAGLGTSASNERAIGAFEKAGFHKYCEFEDPEFGPSLYMLNEIGGSA